MSKAESDNVSDKLVFNRRSVLQGGAIISGTSAVLASETASAKSADNVARRRDKIDVTLKVNDQSFTLGVDSRATLLDTLRHDLGLTGTKKGCDHGQCGACTVHLDGMRILSCLTLTASVQNRKITTIDGLAKGENLHPMQQAFVDHDAFQCGYCTPGQIMSAVALVNEGHIGDDSEIREYMSGNLCRCAAYPNIVAAVKQGADAMEKA